MCGSESSVGFFSGLWDGIWALISMVADIFLDINVYNECNETWFYFLGFCIGLIFFGLAGALLRAFWPFVLLASFVIWIISFFFGSLLGLGFLALIVGTIIFFNINKT